MRFTAEPLVAGPQSVRMARPLEQSVLDYEVRQCVRDQPACVGVPVGSIASLATNVADGPIA
jgi:hypothetical protein